MAAFFPGGKEPKMFTALYEAYGLPDDTSVDIGGHNFLVLPQMLALFEVPEIRLREPERDPGSPFVRADSRLERLRDSYFNIALEHVMEMIEDDFASKPIGEMTELDSAAVSTAEQIRTRNTTDIKTYFLNGAAAALSYASVLANIQIAHDLMLDLRTGRSRFRPKGGRRATAERIARLPIQEDALADFEGPYLELVEEGKDAVPNFFGTGRDYKLIDNNDLALYLYSSALASPAAYQQFKGAFPEPSGETGRTALDSLAALADAIKYQRMRRGASAMQQLERHLSAMLFQAAYVKFISEDFQEEGAPSSRLS